jgi:hypothetical protein
MAMAMAMAMAMVSVNGGGEYMNQQFFPEAIPDRPDEKKKRTVTLFRYMWDTGGCIFQTEWKNFPAELYLGRSESWRLLKTETKNVEIEGE